MHFARLVFFFFDSFFFLYAFNRPGPGVHLNDRLLCKLIRAKLDGMEFFPSLALFMT